MLIEGISVALLPVAFVTIILALIIVIFARDRAVALLRTFYGYGVIIVAFIGVAVAAIALLNTLLNTTIFPSQANEYRPQYFSSSDATMPEPYGIKYEAGVREYLIEQQKQFDDKADQLSQSSEWRETVVVTVPVLLVLLPLLYFFSRRFFAKDELDEVHAQSHQGAIRAAYIYVISYLSLLAMAIGGIGVLNALFTASLMPSPDSSYNVRGLLSQQVNALSRDFTTPAEAQIITRAEAEAAVRAAQADLIKVPEFDAKNALNNRNRALSLSFSFLIIGGVLYFVHRTRKL